jgi:hypothetical protein
MDSIKKSALIGRVATPLFQAVAAIIFAKYGIEIDAETQQIMVNYTATAVSALFGLWGYMTPIISKIREKARCG